VIIWRFPSAYRPCFKALNHLVCARAGSLWAYDNLLHYRLLFSTAGGSDLILPPTLSAEDRAGLRSVTSRNPLRFHAIELVASERDLFKTVPECTEEMLIELIKRTATEGDYMLFDHTTASINVTWRELAGYIPCDQQSMWEMNNQTLMATGALTVLHHQRYVCIDMLKNAPSQLLWFRS
jgi:hypothetical protein